MTTEHTTALKHLIHRPGATCAVYASYNVLTFSGTPTTAALHQHCKITACVIPAVLNTTITALRNGGLRFQVQQSVDSVEPIGCQQLQMIRQHFNREFPAQCLTRSGVEQVGNLVQPLLANQRQIGALG